MPELPEVETVARGLRRHLAGAALGELRHADVRSVRCWPGHFSDPGPWPLRNRTVQSIERLGKYLRFHTDAAAVLVTHLGMTGRLLVCPADRAVDPHTHLRVALLRREADAGTRRRGDAGTTTEADDSQSPRPRVAASPRPARSAGGRPDAGASEPLELRFVNPRWCMGGLWLLGSADDPADPTAKLGPDPLAISAEAFVDLLGGARRQAKALLLDQSAVAGVGNIYADEALFAAGIHPRARCDRLSRPRRARLLEALQDRLRESIARGGSTLRDYRNVDGDVGWFQLSLQVYGKPGLPCPTCGKPITHATVAGRSTHYCTKCQRY